MTLKPFRVRDGVNFSGLGWNLNFLKSPDGFSFANCLRDQSYVIIEGVKNCEKSPENTQNHLGSDLAPKSQVSLAKGTGFQEFG